MTLDRSFAVLGEQPDRRTAQRPMAGVAWRASNGAFHDYVRCVFAECSVRAPLLRASRASWLHRLSRLPALRVRATNLYSRD